MHIIIPELYPRFHFLLSSLIFVFSFVQPEAMNQIMSMGFSREQAIRALSSSENDVERAIEFLFS